MTDPDREIRVDVRLKQALQSGTLPRQLVIVGPAATGKTWAVLAILHLLACDYPRLRILIVRKTRKSLTESALVTYEQEILPADGCESIAYGATRVHRSIYRYPNGSEIVPRGLDEPTGVYSSAWDVVYVNEAIELAEDGWDTLGSRSLRPGRDTRFGWLLGDTNPGDPAHWLKKRIDEGRTKEWQTVHRANPAMHDGFDWTPGGRVYLEEALEPLQGTRRKRLLLGLWAAGEGTWFETFGEGHCDDARAEFDPRWPVTLAIDTGVHTGAVWFQVREAPTGPTVHVFGDYYAFGRPAYENALAIKARTLEVCGRVDKIVTDPAGKASNPIGPTVLGEYERAGLRCELWPSFPGSVVDGLSLIESFVATDPPALFVHSRATNLITAFANYRRAKRGGRHVDRPEDEQHPYEDLMDPLRGGLQERFPEGRKPGPRLRTVHVAGGRYR